MSEYIQKTIKDKVEFSGKALQTGCNVKVTCFPGEINTGIVFKRTDISNSNIYKLGHIPLNTAMRRTVVGDKNDGIHTVEHFLSALWALGISNLLINVEGPEMPAMDGSAIEYYKKIQEIGINIQDEKCNVIKITDIEKVQQDDKFIEIIPNEKFNISYNIDYNVSCIKKEVFVLDNINQDIYEKQIASARTFCLKEEAEALLRMGLGKGATYENTLVLDNNGPIQTTFRFPNEPVRHKVLDLIGDFYLLGKPIIGKVIANKTGHDVNVKMIQLIKDKYC